MTKIKRENIDKAIKVIEKHKVTILYAMQTPEFVKFVTGNLTDEERDRMAKRIRRNMNGDV